MTYDEWVAQVPKSIEQYPLWQFEVYPKALLLADFVWEDCGKLMRDVRGRKVAEQLIDSAGSVSANIEEGFGRGYGRDYARFLGIALGSDRESRGWYYRSRKLFTAKILEYRYPLLKEIIALLVTHIKKQNAFPKKQKATRKVQAASA
jgi:four helix bundle protein